MGVLEATGGTKNPEPTTIHMHFPSESPVQPEGLEGLSLEDEVEIVIRGRVNDLSRNEYRDEDEKPHLSRSLGVEVMGFLARPVKNKQESAAEALYPGMAAGGGE